MKVNPIRDRIKTMLKDSGLNLTKIAEELNQRYPDDKTSQQNISNKLSRGTIKFSEVIDIADICGYDVVFRKRSESFELIKAAHEHSDGKSKTLNQIIESVNFDYDNLFDTKLFEGHNFANGKFYSFIVVGAAHTDASETFQTMTELSSTNIEEIMIAEQCGKKFDVIIKPVGRFKD